jgi:hypothetical protein
MVTYQPELLGSPAQMFQDVPYNDYIESRLRESVRVQRLSANRQVWIQWKVSPFNPYCIRAKFKKGSQQGATPAADIQDLRIGSDWARSIAPLLQNAPRPSASKQTNQAFNTTAKLGVTRTVVVLTISRFQVFGLNIDRANDSTPAAAVD